MKLLKENCAREVGDGLSYDLKLGCQLGGEEVRVGVWSEKGIEDP